ncbi:hypothetical protein [Pseudalkalibacillus berkeleyi]|uniref:Uncharacterized protein n=1 Tax=Pseudalkalibacillus berkeleyi TaxID=1069813 RepID=A0ABS9H1G6_9BACL|nr:hypothetical protein [Pseudalkalibacillus berkeleyi]MCF6137673.1 hypothetical protein [Pseudalkalibacillus berkeleyi]
MLFSASIILLAILFIAVELPPLIREKRIYPSIIYIVVLLTGSTLLVLYGFDIKLPNPLDIVVYIFKPVSTSIFTFFK